MKKLLLTLLTLIILTACTESREASPYPEINTLDDFWVEVKAATVSPMGLTITFHNDTDLDVSYGAWFRLEERSGGQWYSVEPVTSWGQDDWAVVLSSQGWGDWDYSWDWYYGALERGDYRIVIQVSPWEDHTETYYVAAEFSVELR